MDSGLIMVVAMISIVVGYVGGGRGELYPVQEKGCCSSGESDRNGRRSGRTL